MDIYIVRKCRVEVKEFAGTNGAKHAIPVMTKEDVYSYVITAALDSSQRQMLQEDLENYYTVYKGEGD